MPIRVDRAPNVSVHKYFWEALTLNSDTLGLSQLWLCGLDIDKLLKIGKILQTDLPIYEPNMWSEDQLEVNNNVLTPRYFFGVGSRGGSAYLLTQGASFIADGLNNSRVGVNQSGAIKGLVVDSRLDLNATTITFLETNVSFVDGFLRPWAALVGHRSIKNSDLRLNIELMCLQKWSLNEPLRVRKSMVLRNAVPINIDAEEYNYSGDKILQRQVQFAFDRYDMIVNPDISYDSVASYSGTLKEKNQLQTKPDRNFQGWIVFDEKGNKPSILSQAKAEAKGNGNPPMLGEKNYETVTQNINKPTSILGKIEQFAEKASEVVTNIQGMANDITSNVAQGLNAFGLTEAANDVSQFNQDLQSNFLAPAADVVGTGQQYVQGAQILTGTVQNITGNSNVTNSDTVAASLRSNTQTVQGKTNISAAEAGEQAISNVRSATQQAQKFTGNDVTTNAANNAINTTKQAVVGTDTQEEGIAKADNIVKNVRAGAQSAAALSTTQLNKNTADITSTGIIKETGNWVKKANIVDSTQEIMTIEDADLNLNLDKK